MILHVLPSKNPAEHNRKESETQRVTREKKEQEEREKKIEKEYKVWYRLHHFSQVIGLQGYTIFVTPSTRPSMCSQVFVGELWQQFQVSNVQKSRLLQLLESEFGTSFFSTCSIFFCFLRLPHFLTNDFILNTFKNLSLKRSAA